MGFTWTVLASASGCAFLFDFPEQGSIGGAGGAGSGASSNGAGDAGGAGGSLPTPSIEAVPWQTTPSVEGDGAFVAITSLTHNPDEDLLYAFGHASDGLADLGLPLGQGGQVFVVGLPQTGAPELLMNAIACDAGARVPLTGRAGQWYNADELFLPMTLPSSPGSGNRWALGYGSLDMCGSGDELVVTPTNTSSPTDVPSFVLFDGFDLSGTVCQDCDGVAFEVTYRDPVFALLGATSGDPFLEPNSDSSYFVMLQDDVQEPPVVEIKVFDDIPQEAPTTGKPKPSWTGGIAVDELGRGWLGGGACDIGSGCDDPQVVFGVASLFQENPELLVKQTGRRGIDISAATSVEHADGIVLVAGQYQGELGFLSITLPAVVGAVPFVVAVESTNNTVRWSYPASSEQTGDDALRWQSITDMAVTGDKSDGAVFVVGCSAPLASANVECATLEPGKTGFVKKLDLATGALLWSGEMMPTDGAHAFLPTAVTATAEHVWFAAQLLGSVDLWGQPLESAGAGGAVVIQLAP